MSNQNCNLDELAQMIKDMTKTCEHDMKSMIKKVDGMLDNAKTIVTHTTETADDINAMLVYLASKES